MKDPERRVHALAANQYGVFTREQALHEGMSIAEIERRIKNGRFERIHPSVYRAPGAPVTGRQRALAASLWLGADAHVSHLTGGALLRLDGFRQPPLHVMVLRENRRRVPDSDITVHRVLELPRQDRFVVDGIPCTSATRTLIDCASLLDAEALEVAFESARRMGLTSPRALARRFEELCGPGRAGTKALRDLLAHQRDGDPALQYKLEVKMARLLRTSNLPRPERQVAVGRFRLDFGFTPESFAVECEGFEWHGNRLQWKRDKRRTAWIERQGWRLMFVTWDDVNRYPEETLERIRIALRAPFALRMRR